MPNLLEQKCRSAGVTAMDEHDIHNHLAQVSGWQQVGDSIEKIFTFKDDLEAVVFVNALAWTSHVEDHHPDLLWSFNRCRVSFSTHSAHGITLNDFICAAKADALIAFAG